MSKKYISSDLYVGAIFSVIAFFFLMQAKNFPSISKYFPSISLGAFLFFSLLLTALGIRKTIEGRKDPSKAVNPKFYWKSYALAGGIIVYVLCVGFIGYFVSSLVFMPLGMLFFGQRKWKLMIPVTVGLLGFLYWLFIVELNMYMGSTGILF